MLLLPPAPTLLESLLLPSCSCHQLLCRSKLRNPSCDIYWFSCCSGPWFQTTSFLCWQTGPSIASCQMLLKPTTTVSTGLACRQTSRGSWPRLYPSPGCLPGGPLPSTPLSWPQGFPYPPLIWPSTRGPLLLLRLVLTVYLLWRIPAFDARQARVFLYWIALNQLCFCVCIWVLSFLKFLEQRLQLALNIFFAGL